jgi:hypothetical protein
MLTLRMMCIVYSQITLSCDTGAIYIKRISDVVGMKCHATSFLNNLNVREVQNYAKCVELEIQLSKYLKN